MEARAYLKYARISPRKVSILLDLIRKQPADKAKAILQNTSKSGSELLLKLLESAMANAENNHGMDVEKLYVAEIYSNAGPMLKRIRARAQGRAFRILKRTSHTTIILKELGAKEEVVTKVEEPKKIEVKEEAPKAEKKPAAKKTTSSTAKKTTTAKKSTTATAEKKTTTAKKTTAKKADGEEAPKPRKPRAKKADTATTEEA